MEPCICICICLGMARGIVAREKKKMSAGKQGKHFVLVHGAFHGGWCWYEVVCKLKSDGHIVTVLDLAASGINPKQVGDVRTFSAYNEPLIQFMSSLPSDHKVILVGHSFGGINISVAMEMFPEKVSVAVFATALMISEDVTYKSLNKEVMKHLDSMDCERIYRDKLPIGLMPGPKYMASKLYPLSQPRDLSLASSLVRPVPLFHDLELLARETAVTKERNGSVHKVFIKCCDDTVVVPQVQDYMTEKNPPDWGVLEIMKADHMLMLSAPQQLYDCLLRIANRC